MEKRFPIVAIGASAGGVEALSTFFEAMPPDAGMAFILVLHLASDRHSYLIDILSEHAALPVKPATDGEKIVPNIVSVLQPGTTVTVAHGRLVVRKVDTAAPERRPIDVLFSSLAVDQGEMAVGIVLSGAGSDGALGIKAIKEFGGLTLAQGTDSSGPRHEGMPVSAIATGAVDVIAPAEMLPERLIELCRKLATSRFAGDDEGDGAENVAAAREQICTILRNRLGHDFSGYKKNTFWRRVERRMQVLSVDTIEDYVKRLERDPAEATILFRDLLINVTSFFRDPDAFEVLEKEVIPRLFEGKQATDSVRAWVPGCATGEEVFSLAIMLREHMDTLQAPPHVAIFATDIDDHALAIARASRYPASLLRGVSKKRLRRFFVADGESYVVRKAIREMCVFSAHSIIRDPPFSRIDLVSCRNLLIYLGPELQARLISIFHYALRPGGFLMLGTSENVTQHAELFAPVDKKQRVFQRRDHPTRPVQFPLAAPDGRSQIAAAHANLFQEHGSLPFRRMIESRILERLAPAHVVVNREGDIVHYSARTGKYLEAAAGTPNRNIFASARPGLRIDLRAALQSAKESQGAVERQAVAIERDDGGMVYVRLRVEPLSERDADPLYLVAFQDVERPPEHAAIERAGPAESQIVTQLENELRDTRERLQSSIEEYETSVEELRSANEELVSVNEELQSTNEELETSKEEIQSVNEELRTVNTELGDKVGELDVANNDLRNLFESTEVATVFLDSNLIISSFTPAATKLFALRPGDRGRPLSEIASQIDMALLRHDIQAMRTSGQAIERRVITKDTDTNYLLRVLPYRSGNAIAGAVLTFVDISMIIEAEQQQKLLVAELNHRVRNMLSVVAGLATLTISKAESLDAFRDVFLGRIQSLGRTFGLLTREKWGTLSLRVLVETELEPYGAPAGDHVAISGLDVALKPKVALAMGMVFHELATNAVKYGAFSVPEGKVNLSWTAKPPPQASLVVRWIEKNGPRVKVPKLKGFGTELIDRELSYELGGTAELTYAPTGLEAVLTVPIG